MRRSLELNELASIIDYFSYVSKTGAKTLTHLFSFLTLKFHVQ